MSGWSTFCIKMIVLPRQARDKSKGKLKDRPSSYSETGSTEVQELKLAQCQLMIELGLTPAQSVVYRYNPAEKFALEIKCHSKLGPDSCWNKTWTNPHQPSVGADGYILFIGPETECKKCMRPYRLWVDSMYWSLTTMTTIGYGDRGQ